MPRLHTVLPRTCGLCGCTEQIVTLITGEKQTNFLPSLPVCIACAVQQMQAPVPAAAPAHRISPEYIDFDTRR